jgi:hypothetical protein
MDLETQLGFPPQKKGITSYSSQVQKNEKFCIFFNPKPNYFDWSNFLWRTLCFHILFF